MEVFISVKANAGIGNIHL